MAARDPNYAKLVMKTLEKRNKMDVVKDLQDAVKKLETHL